MDRAIKFCHWKAQKWMDVSSCSHIQLPYVAEGARAYALEQADVEERRGKLWVAEWNALIMQARNKVLPSLEGDEEPEIDIEIKIDIAQEVDSDDEGGYIEDNDIE
jgi:hypothetical protein